MQPVRWNGTLQTGLCSPRTVPRSEFAMQALEEAPVSSTASPPDVAGKLAGVLVRRLADLGLQIATAESCTAGQLSTLLAAATGASHVLRAGFVVYSKAAKTDVLGVPPAMMAGPRGAVTSEVAQTMARRARMASGADIAVSVTGVIGPSCDEDGNPVGRVEIACDRQDGRSVCSLDLTPAPREVLSIQVVTTAFELVLEAITPGQSGRQWRVEHDNDG